MHEFSLCHGLVDVVLQRASELEPKVSRISRIRVVIGRLRQVVPGTLHLAFESLTRGTLAEGSELDIVFRNVCLKCHSCGWQGEVEGHIFLCPNCQAKNVELITGTELFVEHMEVEQDDKDNAGNQCI